MATATELGERALRRIGVSVIPPADRPGLAAVVPVATIATNALIFLAVIASDETPLPSDQTLAEAKVSLVHSSLVAQAIVSWDVAAIPAAVAEDYCVLAAVHLAPAFGKPTDAAMIGAMEKRIRWVAMIMRAPDLAIQAVADVHNDLAARNRVRWSVQDIPVGAESAYVALAASSLAPQFGMQAAPADMPLALRQLAQAIALGKSNGPVMAVYF